MGIGDISQGKVSLEKGTLKGHILDNPSTYSLEIIGFSINIVPFVLYEDGCE